MNGPRSSSTHAVLWSALCLLACACGPKADGPGSSDPYQPKISRPALSGEPVTVRRTRTAGQVFRSKGTTSQRRVARGRFGAQPIPPDRTFSGNVEATRRVTLGEKGQLVSRIEGKVDGVATMGAAAPKPILVAFTLTFEEEPAGGAVHRSIKFDAPTGDATDFETLAAAFTDRFSLPEKGIRVGEDLNFTEVMQLDESLRRPLFFLFQESARRGKPANAPIEGSVWVQGREKIGTDDVLDVRIVLMHAYADETLDPPTDPRNVRIDYRAAIEGRRAVVLDGGWTRDQDVAVRRRIAYRATDFDYTVEVEGRTALVTTLEK